MSLITRCPACETMFKVVPDQLRISEGWARCGQCGEIFDAAGQLVDDAVPPPAAAQPTASPGAVEAPASIARPPTPAPSAVPSAEAPAPRSPSPTAMPAPSAAPDFAGAFASPSIAEPLHAGAAPAQPAQDFAAVDPIPVAPRSPPAVPEPPLADAVAPAATSPHVADAASGPDSVADFPPTEAEDDTPQPSFLRDSERPSVWRRPAVRITLLVLALLLAGLLGVQFLLHERDRIVSMEPSTRPVLAALCAVARCDLAALRQIEAVVIDSSSFSRVRGESYRLAFALRNNSGLDLAMPAVELALTDTQDQAVIRRVIVPAEFGAASRLLAAGSDWSGSLSLNVRAAPGAERVAGYRLLAFYP